MLKLTYNKNKQPTLVFTHTPDERSACEAHKRHNSQLIPTDLDINMLLDLADILISTKHMKDYILIKLYIYIYNIIYSYILYSYILYITAIYTLLFNYFPLLYALSCP